MSVTVGEVSTEFTIAPETRDRGDSGGASSAGGDEVRLEELRAIVRELIAEELERYLRLAVDR